LPPEKPSRDWPSTKSRQALAALLRIGWTIKRQRGTSHRILARPGWQDLLFAYHDRVTLGPTAMKVLTKKTGLTPQTCRQLAGMGGGAPGLPFSPGSSNLSVTHLKQPDVEKNQSPMNFK